MRFVELVKHWFTGGEESFGPQPAEPPMFDVQDNTAGGPTWVEVPEHDDHGQVDAVAEAEEPPGETNLDPPG
ncbi:MAG: hypothetical protein OEO77_00965 [Acidimicrobiia bacterium]|nr:hypothetical protein [Acidimicrobiia bacterium]